MILNTEEISAVIENEVDEIVFYSKKVSKLRVSMDKIVESFAKTEEGKKARGELLKRALEFASKS